MQVMADETEETTDTPTVNDGCEECLFDGADKIRAGLSLVLAVILIGIAVDVLSGGKITGRFRATATE